MHKQNFSSFNIVVNSFASFTVKEINEDPPVK